MKLRTLILFAILFCCGITQATTYPKLTLEAQAERAEVIVRATIRAVQPEERNKRPWRVYGLTVQQTWRGDAAALPKLQATPSFAVLGGDKLKLEGAPSFKENEEWILFLYTKAYDSPIVGFNQGAYRVQGENIFDSAGNVVQLEANGKKTPATRASFVAELERILGVTR
jgi:hypothetical protein